MSEEIMRPYECAIVEVEPNKFLVAYPYEVEIGLKEKGYIKIAGEGRYAFKPHLIVLGGKEIPTIGQFRENVGAVVNRLMTEATPEKPLTLDTIREALPDSQYKARTVKGLMYVLTQYTKTDAK